jgi:hypothetical protein
MIPKKGDTVRLAGSVTQAEFGLALCDDDGEPLQIDGKVWKVGDLGVYVVIKRMRHRRPPFAAQPGSVARWVKPEEVLEVLEGEARMWPNAAALKSVSDEREGRAKTKAVPVFWTVGVDEIPDA